MAPSSTLCLWRPRVISLAVPIRFSMRTETSRKESGERFPCSWSFPHAPENGLRPQIGTGRSSAHTQCNARNRARASRREGRKMKALTRAP
jgi:hypothetical protein